MHFAGFFWLKVWRYRKINYFCTLKKQNSHETYISTIQQEKKKQAWIQEKDVNRQWQTSTCCPQGKGAQKAHRF